MHTEREGGGLSLGEAGKRGCSLPHVAILERILHAGIRDSLLRAGRAESIKKEREEGGGAAPFVFADSEGSVFRCLESPCEILRHVVGRQ